MLHYLLQSKTLLLFDKKELERYVYMVYDAKDFVVVCVIHVFLHVTSLQ